MRLLLVMPNIISYLCFHRELGAELCADGGEVHVACSHTRLGDPNAKVADALPKHEGLTIHAFDFPRGMNPAGHLRAARQLGPLVARLKPDVVHAHFDAAIFTTAVARTKRWPATIATFHGLSFPLFSGWRKMLIRSATVWAVRHFNTVLVLNSTNRDMLRAAAPGANIRMFGSAGVGCDITRFAPAAKADRDAMRAKLGFSPGDCVFVYVGRFVEIKGFALTVRAFLQLAEREPNARLLLVGEGDALHPSGLTSEEEAKFRASPRIVDLGQRNDVERCLAAADVMVLPSFREGMPVGLMEALSMGVPVLTRDVPGCRDVVRDNLDGIVLRDCTVESIATTMKQLADSPELRRRLSDRALADRDRFSRKHFIREQREIYDDCLSPLKQTPAPHD